MSTSGHLPTYTPLFPPSNNTLQGTNLVLGNISITTGNNPSTANVAIGSVTGQTANTQQIGIGTNVNMAVASAGAIAIGNNASVTSGSSVAIGANALVTGNGNLAIGLNATATGSTAITAINATATNLRATAIGVGTASGQYAIAIGYTSVADGGSSIAIGRQATNATFGTSVALGYLATNTAANQIMLGTSSQTVTFPGKGLFSDTSASTTNMLALNYFSAAAPSGAAANGSICVGWDGVAFRIYARCGGAWLATPALV